MYDNEEPASRQSQNNGAVADLLHVRHPASPITLESEMPHTQLFGPVDCTATHRREHIQSRLRNVVNVHSSQAQEGAV